MYGQIPGGGAAVGGGGVLVATGGNVFTTVMGTAIIIIAVGIFILLAVRERRRLRYLAAQEAIPRPHYRRFGDHPGTGA